MVEFSAIKKSVLGISDFGGISSHISSHWIMLREGTKFNNGLEETFSKEEVKWICRAKNFLNHSAKIIWLALATKFIEHF